MELKEAVIFAIINESFIFRKVMINIKEILPTILLFIISNIVELLILGYLFIVYSSLLPSFWLNIFLWHETDPISILIVWYLVIIFLFIGGILKEIGTKVPISKLNATLPFYTIGYLAVTIFTVDKFRNFYIISSWLVIVISFISIIITTIISLRKITISFR